MVTLIAEKRDAFGKKLKTARESGKLPVVVYGAKEASTPFFVQTKEFKKVLKEAGESTIVKFHTDKGDKDVLIYDVAYNPRNGEPIHVDFYAVEKGKAVKVHVPLTFEGVAPAVKELGGNLVKVVHELEVEALPADLPHEIVIDISLLTTLESQILIKDLKLPKGVTTVLDAEEVVAAMSAGGEVVVEETTPVDLSTIEVEKKGKKEEEGEGEGEGEAPAAE